MRDLIKDKNHIFISYEGPKLPSDPGVRHSIKQRAMKHAAAIRKQSGGYTRQNVRQLPEWILGPVSPSRNCEKPAAKGCLDGEGPLCPKDTRVSTRTQYQATATTLWPVSTGLSLSQPSLQIHSQKYSLLSLVSPLTMLHLGISTLACFASEPASIGTTLSEMSGKSGSRRLLSFIPSRYGCVPAITDATNCLVARLERIVRAGDEVSNGGEMASLKCYTKALRSLQEAINDEGLRMLPETLCAAQLLGLYELLDGQSDNQRWIRHAGGAARLIELRGPDRFQTDFELSLFIAHAGPIITESLLNGKKCFLDEERWQIVIQAASRNDPLISPEQAGLVLGLWARLGKLPKVFKEVEELILKPSLTQIGARENLVEILLREQDHLEAWLALAQQELGQIAAGGWHSGDYTLSFIQAHGAHSTNLGGPTWRVLQGTFLLCSLIKSRALFALSPSQFPDMEVRCQALAHEAMDTTKYSVGKGNGRFIDGLFISEASWMAKAVIETSEIWRKSSMDLCYNPAGADSGAIEGWRFKAWCRAMGRTVLC